MTGAIALQAAASRAQVRERVEEILARPEFRRASGRDWIEDVIGWLADLFDFAPREETLSLFLGAVEVLLVLLAGALLFWLLLHLGREMRRARGAVPTEARDLARARRVDALRREARAAEGRGDGIEALRLYFFALVVGLGERGDLEYRDAWTNRELLERGDPSPRVEQQLAPLVAALDAHSFGRVPAGERDVRRFSDLCARWLGAGGEA